MAPFLPPTRLPPAPGASWAALGLHLPQALRQLECMNPGFFSHSAAGVVGQTQAP